MTRLAKIQYITIHYNTIHYNTLQNITLHYITIRSYSVMKPENNSHNRCKPHPNRQFRLCRHDPPSVCIDFSLEETTQHKETCSGGRDIRIRDSLYLTYHTTPLEKSEATLSVLSIPAIIVRKYVFNLNEQNTANSFYPPLSLFWRSMFI